MSTWAGPDADAGERKRLIITPAGLEAIGVESPRAGDGTTTRLRSSVHSPRRKPRDRVASWACCWTRSRVRKARRSKI